MENITPAARETERKVLRKFSLLAILVLVVAATGCARHYLSEEEDDYANRHIPLPPGRSDWYCLTDMCRDAVRGIYPEWVTNPRARANTQYVRIKKENSLYEKNRYHEWKITRHGNTTTIEKIR